MDSLQKYIAYLRVSTDKQGVFGLGMDAQREAVARYVANRGTIIAKYVEVESGRKSDRPQLMAALAELPPAEGNSGHRKARPTFP